MDYQDVLEFRRSVHKYTKKPVTIEAIQWSGDNFVAVDNFITVEHETYPSHGIVKIPTLEGTLSASVNDFIIKGVKGEFYPCKPDIFLSTYTPVKMEENNADTFKVGDTFVIELPTYDGSEEAITHDVIVFDTSDKYVFVCPYGLNEERDSIVYDFSRTLVYDINVKVGDTAIEKLLHPLTNEEMRDIKNEE